MTTFQSTSIINKPISEVYSFLADMNNHQQLMPDNIEDWSSTVNTASFSIPKMTKLALKIENRVPESEVLITPAIKPPFDLEIKWELSAVENHTEVLLTISADLNMMMKMLASKPLQKLVDEETANLNKLLSYEMPN